MKELHLKTLKQDSPLFIEASAAHQAAGSKLIMIAFVNQWLYVIITEDGKEKLFHLSVSHPTRYPTWDEIKALRYALLPNNKTFGLLFPPKDQYVDIHPNCFHLHEVPQLHESSGLWA